MEHQLWPLLNQELRRLARPYCKGCDYSDGTIVRVYYWAVLHDRPTSWACVKRNWPIHERRRPFPSPSTMSRRLRSPSVVALLKALEETVLRPGDTRGWVCAVDGKPLVIGGCSKDRQAGYGRAAGGKAKGYKLHALVGLDASVLAWRVAPMNRDERVMARRLLRNTSAEGYVLADGNYDDNRRHDLCVDRGNLQLVAPRRYGFDKGLGHHRHSPGRLHAIELLTNPMSDFGWQLLKQRDQIERFYGNLTSFAAGLSHLPAWVRTHRRVHLWVQAKLIFNALRIRIRNATYVA